MVSATHLRYSTSSAGGSTGGDGVPSIQEIHAKAQHVMSPFLVCHGGGVGSGFASDNSHHNHRQQQEERDREREDEQHHHQQYNSKQHYNSSSSSDHHGDGHLNEQYDTDGEDEDSHENQYNGYSSNSNSCLRKDRQHQHHHQQQQQFNTNDDIIINGNSSSSTSTVVLIDLILRRQFAQAIQRVQTVPSEARCCSSSQQPNRPNNNPTVGNHQNLALHEACKQHQVPMELIDALILANADATSVPGQGGYLPLHLACSYICPTESSSSSSVTAAAATSAQVVAKLIVAYPSATRNKDNVDGTLPLHLAVRWGADMDVIMALLAVHPRASTVKDGSGKTPLDHAESSQRRRVRSGNSSAGSNNCNNDATVRALKLAPILIAVSKAAMKKMQYETDIKLKQAESKYEERILRDKDQYEQDKTLAVSIEVQLRKELSREKETTSYLQTKIQLLEQSLQQKEHELDDTKRVLRQIQGLTGSIKANDANSAKANNGIVGNAEGQHRQELPALPQKQSHQGITLTTGLGNRGREDADLRGGIPTLDNHNHFAGTPMSQQQQQVYQKGYRNDESQNHVQTNTNHQTTERLQQQLMAAHPQKQNQRDDALLPKQAMPFEPHHHHRQEQSKMTVNQRQQRRHHYDHAQNSNITTQIQQRLSKEISPPLHTNPDPVLSATSFSSKKSMTTPTLTNMKSMTTPIHSNVKRNKMMVQEKGRKNQTASRQSDGDDGSGEERRDPSSGTRDGPTSSRSDAVASVKEWFTAEAEALAQSEEDLLSRILASEKSFGDRDDKLDDVDDHGDNNRKDQEVDAMIEEMEKASPFYGGYRGVEEQSYKHRNDQDRRTKADQRSSIGNRPTRRSSPRKQHKMVSVSSGVESGTDTSMSVPEHRPYYRPHPTSPSKQSLLNRSKAPGQQNRIESVEKFNGLRSSSQKDPTRPQYEPNSDYGTSSQNGTSRSFQQQKGHEQQFLLQQRQRHVGHYGIPPNVSSSVSSNRKKDIHQMRLDVEQTALLAGVTPPPHSFSSSISTRNSVLPAKHTQFKSSFTPTRPTIVHQETLTSPSLYSNTVTAAATTTTSPFAPSRSQAKSPSRKYQQNNTKNGLVDDHERRFFYPSTKMGSVAVGSSYHFEDVDADEDSTLMSSKVVAYE